jgi:hypothetical protein
MKQTTLVLLLFFTVITSFSGSAQTLSKFDEKTIGDYLDFHSSDSLTWWLIDSGLQVMLEKKIVEVNDCINVFKGKIPPTTVLADYLKKTTFRFGYLANDSAIFPALKNNLEQGAGLSICFVPFRFKHYRPFVFYEVKEKRLLVWAAKCPETIFAALFFYGLHRAAADSPPKDYAQNRDGLMTAASILNQAGHGEFFDYLDSLLAKLPAENPLIQISADDLKNIDAKIGAKVLGRELAKEILPIYSVALQNRLMLKKSRQR